MVYLEIELHTNKTFKNISFVDVLELCIQSAYYVNNRHFLLIAKAMVL